MHLIRSHRFVYIQFPQVVTNLIFSDSGMSFNPLVPILWTIGSGGVRIEVASED